MAVARDDSMARWVGLAVFALGVGCLVLVFVLAYRDLTASGVLGRLAGTSSSVDATGALLTLGVKFALFIVLGYVGSAIAGRGIGLYAASRGSDDV